MISTKYGIFVKDISGLYVYMSDSTKGGTAFQWAEDVLCNLPPGPTWFKAGGRVVPIDKTESASDLYYRWYKTGVRVKMEVSTF